MKTTLSVAIATFNEADNIERCLDAVSPWVDEIIVVDGHSSDDTVKIIKKYKNAKVIPTDNKAMFHLNKQMAIDACTSDWILQLDADEVVTPELRDEILNTIKDTNYNGFGLKEKTFFSVDF